MYLLWLIPESYIRRGEDSLALQSRERRGGKKEASGKKLTGEQREAAKRRK